MRGRINRCKFLAPKQVRWKPVTTWNGSLPAECFLMFFILGKLRLSWYSTSYVLRLPCSQLCGNRLIPALFRWGSGRAPVSEEVCWFLFCLGHYCWGTLDKSLDLCKSSLLIWIWNKGMEQGFFMLWSLIPRIKLSFIVKLLWRRFIVQWVIFFISILLSEIGHCFFLIIYFWLGDYCFTILCWSLPYINKSLLIFFLSCQDLYF